MYGSALFPHIDVTWKMYNMRNLLLLRRVVFQEFRKFHTTRINGVREIVTKKEGNVTTVEGKILPSPREGFVLQKDTKILNNSCILCQLNLDIKHTDVLILKQFITKNGTVLPRKVTGLCYRQHRRIYYLVAMAQEAGLLGNFVTWEGFFDVSKREGFKKQNTYFDESTIKPYPGHKWMKRRL